VTDQVSGSAAIPSDIDTGEIQWNTGVGLGTKVYGFPARANKVLIFDVAADLLEDLKLELVDSEASLVVSEAALVDSEAKLVESEVTLDDTRKELKAHIETLEAKLVKSEAALVGTKNDLDATKADVETVEAKLVESAAALIVTRESLTTCTGQEHSSGSKESSGDAAIAALAAILVVVVIMAVVYIRKLAGQVEATRQQKALPGRHDTLPMTNNPLIQRQQQQQPGATNGTNVYDVGAPIVRPSQSNLPAAVELTTNPLYASSLAESNVHGTGAPLASNA
jgi:hypothetical protein